MRHKFVKFSLTWKIKRFSSYVFKMFLIRMKLEIKNTEFHELTIVLSELKLDSGHVPNNLS